MSGHLSHWHDGGAKQHLGKAVAFDHSKEQRNMGNGFSQNISQPGVPSLSDDYMERAKGFLGVPRGFVQNRQQYYEHNLETFPDNFSDAFNDAYGYGQQNNHIAQVMLEKTTATQCYPITRMAPWKEHSSSLTITMNEVRFHQHVLDKLPELAMGRLVTHTQSGGSMTMSRYGISMLMEATFMLTPKGRRTYVLILEQMKIATITTMNTMILVTLLTTTPHKNAGVEGVMDQESATSANGIDAMFTREREMMAIMNKKGGAERLMHISRKTLQARGVGSGNFMVVPGGSDNCFLPDSQSTKYLLSSDDTDENVSQSRGMSETLIASRPYPQGHGTPDWDPFKRRRAIGGFFTLGAHRLEGVPIEQYTTQLMNETVFNTDGGNMAMLSYGELYKYNGSYRFNEFGAPLNIGKESIGRGWVNDMKVYTWGQAQRKYMSPKFQIPFIKMLKSKCTNSRTRKAFLDSLRLLPHGSKQVVLDSKGSYPAASDWNFSFIEAACSRNAKFENVPIIADYLDAMRGERLPAGVRGDIVRKERKRQAESDAPLTLQEMFDANADHALPDVNQSGVDYSMQDGVVMARSGNKAERRQAYRRFRAPKALAPELIEIHKQLEEVRNRIVKKPELEEITKVWVQAIDASSGMTVADKITAFQHLKACADIAHAARTNIATLPVSWRYDAVSGTAQEKLDRALRMAKSLLDLCMERVTVRTDVEVAIRSILSHPNEQTPIEKESIKEDGVASNPSPAALEQRWDPDGHGSDGQVFLADRFFGSTFRKSLPADAFAATLAYPGKVAVFSTDCENLALKDLYTESAAPHTSKLRGPMRKDRKTALAWSILISRIIHHLRDEVKGNQFPIHADDAEATTAWLKINTEIKDCLVPIPTDLEVYSHKHFSKAVLPLSQAYMQEAVELIQKFVEQRFAFIREKAAWDAAKVKHAADARLDYDKLVRNKAASIKLTAAGRGADHIATAWDPRIHMVDYSTIIAEPTEDNVTTTFKAANAALRHLTTGSGTDATFRNLSSQEIDDWMTAHVAKSNPAAADVAKEMATRTNEIQWNDDEMQKLIDRASITSGEFWRFCVEHDLPVPFALRCVRPCQKFTFGSALRMVAGGEDGAAHTFFQMPHMMMGADAGPKLVFGNYSMYASPMVRRPEKLVVFPDVYVCGYHGGAGIKVNNPNSETDKHNWAAGQGASIFVLAIPMNEVGKLTHNWMSITGRLPDHIPCDGVVAQSLLYPGCDAFARFWGFTNTMLRGKQGSHRVKVTNKELIQNTICFQEFQVGWSVSRQGFRDYTLDAGPFGPYSKYCGAEAVLRGTVSVFDDKPSYFADSGGIN